MKQPEISCIAARGANCSGLLGKKTLENEILREALARGEKIMRHCISVVARDVMLRSTLARWLMSAGYSVELAEGERRAREVLAHHRVALSPTRQNRCDRWRDAAAHIDGMAVRRAAGLRHDSTTKPERRGPPSDLA
jgi:hypothetical protein